MQEYKLADGCALRIGGEGRDRGSLLICLRNPKHKLNRARALDFAGELECSALDGSKLPTTVAARSEFVQDLGTLKFGARKTCTNGQVVRLSGNPAVRSEI